MRDRAIQRREAWLACLPIRIRDVISLTRNQSRRGAHEHSRQGYSDIFLALDRRFPDAKYAFLIELKHVKADASEEEIEGKRLEAVGQIDKYLSDKVLLPSLMGNRTIRAVSLVVAGATDCRWRLERDVSPDSA